MTRTLVRPRAAPSWTSVESSAAARRCRRKFLRFFPRGFRDAAYIASERGYKQAAHEHWNEVLGRDKLLRLLHARDFAAVARLAVGVEARTHLLFSFEKMALRDAVRPPRGARAFAEGLYHFLHDTGPLGDRFDAWCCALDDLPRERSRVLTWPVATVFGFLAAPGTHFFFKPNATRHGAERYGYQLPYETRPAWSVYEGVLGLASKIRRDLADLKPFDMIDIQSFVWVQGSVEYDE